MSVILTDIPDELPPASLPNLFLWSGGLILLMVINSATVLYGWPERKSMAEVVFWLLLMGPAIAVWLILFISRLIYGLVEQKFIDNFNQRRSALPSRKSPEDAVFYISSGVLQLWFSPRGVR